MYKHYRPSVNRVSQTYILHLITYTEQLLQVFSGVLLSSSLVQFCYTVILCSSIAQSCKLLSCTIAQSCKLFSCTIVQLCKLLPFKIAPFCKLLSCSKICAVLWGLRLLYCTILCSSRVQFLIAVSVVWLFSAVASNNIPFCCPVIQCCCGNQLISYSPRQSPYSNVSIYVYIFSQITAANSNYS